MKSGVDSRALEGAYDSPPWWYDVRGFFILHLSYNDTLPSLLRFFSKNFASPHLEAAVGTGSFLKLALGWRRRFVSRGPVQGEGFDYEPRMLQGALRRFEGDPQWRFQVADAGALPYGDGTYRSINVANAFHCFPEPERALGELCRVMRPGGTLAMNVLTHSRGWAPLRWIADRIAIWGRKKGILVAPLKEEEVVRMAKATGFEITGRRRRGNNLYFLLKKREGGPA